MMIDGLVDGHFNRDWFRDRNLYVLLHRHGHRLFHMVVHLFFYFVRYWFFNRDGDGLDDGHGDGLRHMHVDGIGLWHGYRDGLGDGHGHRVWNRHTDVLVDRNRNWFVDFYCVGDVVAASVAAFLMASVTARKSGIYGRKSAKECYAYLKESVITDYTRRETLADNLQKTSLYTGLGLCK